METNNRVISQFSIFDDGNNEGKYCGCQEYFWFFISLTSTSQTNKQTKIRKFEENKNIEKNKKKYEENTTVHVI